VTPDFIRKASNLTRTLIANTMSTITVLGNNFNSKFIVADIVKTVGVCAAAGVVIGAASAVYKEWTRGKQKQTFKINLPENVQQSPEFMECIMVLAEVKHAHMQSLERVARRCSSLLSLLTSLQDADPDSVEASVAPAASQIQDSIRRYLGVYYANSGVALVSEAQSYGKDMVPVIRDLRHAHVSFMSGVEGLVHEVHTTVQDKREAKAAAIEYNHLD
jgi:hypothetical protein